MGRRPIRRQAPTWAGFATRRQIPGQGVCCEGSVYTAARTTQLAVVVVPLGDGAGLVVVPEPEPEVLVPEGVVD
jgi:hypothetical protein